MAPASSRTLGPRTCLKVSGSGRSAYGTAGSALLGSSVARSPDSCVPREELDEAMASPGDGGAPHRAPTGRKGKTKPSDRQLQAVHRDRAVTVRRGGGATGRSG